METRTMINRLLAFVVFMSFFAFGSHGLAPPGEARAPNAVKVLLLVDDLYGSSLNIDDRGNNILENFQSYGWKVSIASCKAEVDPSPSASMLGCEVLTPDMMTYQLDNALDWDAIVVIPGNTHQNLVKCPFVLNLLEQAKANDIPLAAWCNGVQVLAAADVINGVKVSVPADNADECLLAGAIYNGKQESPIEDHRIITCGDDTEYCREMCDLIRKTVENSTSLRESMSKKKSKIEMKVCPNPIKTASCIQFELDESAVVHIAVFNQQGIMVMDVVKQEFQSGPNKVTFTPSSLPTGIYYVYLFSSGKLGMQKCMVI